MRQHQCRSGIPAEDKNTWEHKRDLDSFPKSCGDFCFRRRIFLHGLWAPIRLVGFCSLGRCCMVLWRVRRGDAACGQGGCTFWYSLLQAQTDHHHRVPSFPVPTYKVISIRYCLQSSAFHHPSNTAVATNTAHDSFCDHSQTNFEYEAGLPATSCHIVVSKETFLRTTQR